jgi:LPXTG-motif cell wall-anchored protein
MKKILARALSILMVLTLVGLIAIPGFASDECGDPDCDDDHGSGHSHGHSGHGHMRADKTGDSAVIILAFGMFLLAGGTVVVLSRKLKA